MPNQFIADIRHYLNEAGDFPEGLPKPAIKIASFLALLIETATQQEIGKHVKTEFPCRKKQCRGTIATLISDTESEIYWICTECLDEGSISNWQGSKWNTLESPEIRK